MGGKGEGEWGAGLECNERPPHSAFPCLCTCISLMSSPRGTTAGPSRHNRL